MKGRGCLKPSRSEGNTRLYTDSDLERLEVILHLTRDLGVNLAGVEIILNMREKMGEMQAQIQEFIASSEPGTGGAYGAATRDRGAQQSDPGGEGASFDAETRRREKTRVRRSTWSVGRRLRLRRDRQRPGL